MRDEGPVDQVIWLNGLRIIMLDTSVPGEHHGELDDAQLAWLADELARPAMDGTILAMHHPPIPSVLDLAVSVELRDQSRLAEVLMGSDVRAILAGHLHYSSTATFAGIPVSVASASCYTQDLLVPEGGTRPRDGGRSFNLVHVYPTTVLHSVVPLERTEALAYVDAEESARRLAALGVDLPGAPRAPRHPHPADRTRRRLRRRPAAVLGPAAPTAPGTGKYRSRNDVTVGDPHVLGDLGLAAVVEAEHLEASASLELTQPAGALRERGLDVAHPQRRSA